MTRRRKSPSRRVLPVFGQLPFVIIGIGALVAALAGWVTLTTALAAFGISFLCSVMFAAWSIQSYKCPVCGAKLLSAGRLVASVSECAHPAEMHAV